VDLEVSLALRRRRGQPVSADQLAAEAGLSPRGLTGALEVLVGRGFAIESHPLGGIRLLGVPERLDEKEIACRLVVSRIGRTVRTVEETVSTNDLAWQAAADGPARADGLAVFAEHQSAGRGRRGNRWLAPPHSSVLCSVLVWMPDAPSQGGLVTRAAALAVAEAIEDQCRLSVGIKWPNDLVIDDRKVAGILVESRPAGEASSPVVIGVGVNCGQQDVDFPPEIRPHAASLAMFAEQADRTLLARAILARLDRVASGIQDEAQVAEIRRLVAQRCRTIGRRISVREGEIAYTGQVVDLDPDYGIVLRLADGGIRSFDALTTHVVSLEG
jgi:BirA family biotin operon repressor/biotin-[acetyl-CoA-carboxylase] ligase